MNFNELFESLLRSATQRKFWARIPDDHVLNGKGPSRKFVSGQGYFEIRLAEMFLRDRREYWEGFVPLGVVVSEFLYAGKRETVPFLVGNQLLEKIQQYIRGEWVEYRNTRIAGPVPYMGDDVAVFAGLFRSQVTDYSKQLWQFLEAVVKVFDVTQLSRYLDIVRPVQTNLAQLLGRKEIEYRTGGREVFSAHAAPESRACFREGYFAYVNCPELELKPETLWVKDGSLCEGPAPDKFDRLRRYDYCLVEIAQLEQRDDYTAFPFHQLWGQAQAALYENELSKSHRLFLEMCGQVATCPDIVQNQRYDLIRLYKANFERELALARELGGTGRSDGESTRGVRAGSNGSLNPRDAVRRTAQLADAGHASTDAVDGLLELEKKWQAIPGLASTAPKTPLTEEVISAQLQALTKVSRGKRRDPLALSDALSKAAFR